MSTRNTLLIAASALALVVDRGALPRKARTSARTATPEEIASWDISIGPDGAGLPPGSGTPKQGEAVYVAKCLACHGEKGAGKPNDQLVGGMARLPATSPPVKTVGSFWPYATTIFDYVRRAMPYNESKSLTNDEVYAVVAYILQLNGVIGENDHDRRKNTAAGADAEPGWICAICPGELGRGFTSTALNAHGYAPWPRPGTRLAKPPVCRINRRPADETKTAQKRKWRPRHDSNMRPLV